MDDTKRRITKIAREVGKFTWRTLRADGMGTGEGDILHLIRKRDGITQKEICSSLALDKGAVARAVTRMEKKGYIVREKNPIDGRSWILHATQKADDLKKSKAGIEAFFYSWLLEELNQDEKDEFVSLLDRLYMRCREESRTGFRNVSELLEEKNEEEC